MKKSLLLIAVITFIGSNAFGQFSYGGKLGGATTNLMGVGLDNFKPDTKVKFIGGAVINYSFGQRIAIQTELLYQGKGAAFSYYYADENRRGILKINQKLGYFSVPLMIQFKMGDRYNYFHFDAGLVSNSLIHSEFTGTLDAENDEGEVIHEDEVFEMDQTPANFDLSYAFGIGLVANGLNFDFRMEFGTNKVFENTDGNAPNVLNKSFQVTVGYTFRY